MTVVPMMVIMVAQGFTGYSSGSYDSEGVYDDDEMDDNDDDGHKVDDVVHDFDKAKHSNTCQRPELFLLHHDVSTSC